MEIGTKIRIIEPAFNFTGAEEYEELSVGSIGTVVEMNERFESLKWYEDEFVVQFPGSHPDEGQYFRMSEEDTAWELVSE
jgi:hypothetical protein